MKYCQYGYYSNAYAWIIVIYIMGEIRKRAAI